MIAANIATVLAEAKRLRAIENRRTMVRTITAVHLTLAEFLRQGRLSVDKASGQRIHCFDLRPHSARLLLMVRCGVMTHLDMQSHKKMWFFRGTSRRSKVPRKVKGFITGRNERGTRKPVKPAKGRARNGHRS